jgi:hypothetical protein
MFNFLRFQIEKKQVEFFVALDITRVEYLRRICGEFWTELGFILKRNLFANLESVASQLPKIELELATLVRGKNDLSVPGDVKPAHAWDGQKRLDVGFRALQFANTTNRARLRLLLNIQMESAYAFSSCTARIRFPEPCRAFVLPLLS